MVPDVRSGKESSVSKFLKSRELCPIHRSYFCTPCHKPKSVPQQRQGERKGRKSAVHASAMRSPRFSAKPAVTKIEDSTVGRGYREVCNDRELRRRKQQMISQAIWNGTFYCYHCERDLSKLDFTRIHLSHKQSKGMGAGRRDDHYENLYLACDECNVANGSKRVA